MRLGKRIRLVEVLLIVWVFVGPERATAVDYGKDEGDFINASHSTNLNCYKDVAGTSFVCEIPIPPKGHCHGDAVGVAVGRPVFKAPNRAMFNCRIDKHYEFTCSPADTTSLVRILGASLLNGLDRYWQLDWDTFFKKMGQKAVYRCDETEKPMQLMRPAVPWNGCR